MRLLLMSAAFILVATTILAADIPWPPQILFDQFQGEREMLDLRAQQDMAKWAFWMTLATGFSVLVGAAGTAAVVVNIKQTRAALKEAERANSLTERYNRIETRPFLVVSKLEINSITLSKTSDAVHIFLDAAVHVKNSGRTPAVSAIITCDILQQDMKDAVGRRIGGVKNATLSTAPDEIAKLSIVERQSFKKERWDNIDRALSLCIDMMYKDHHEDHFYFTSWLGFLRFPTHGGLCKVRDLPPGTFTAELDGGHHITMR